MATYAFNSVLVNPDLVAAFDPAVDQLDLQATAIAVKVRFGSNAVTFETAAGTVTLPVLATQLVSGGFVDDNLLLSAGSLKFGDNALATTDDGLGNAIFGKFSQGNQYHGLDGNDTYTGGTAPDVVYGNKGADSILGYAGADTLYGGQGDDWIAAKAIADAGDVVIYGNLDTDTLRAGSGDDVIYGGQGGDSMIGLAGNDAIYGNKDDDRIFGGAGNDTLYGGQGNDLIADSGNAATNLIYGNLGADTVSAVDGANFIYGGQGDDVIFIFGGTGVVKGNKGNDSLVANGASGHVLYGGPGNDILDNSLAGSGTLYGESGVNDGAASRDTLLGGVGAETIFAGLGDNSVSGGSGGDMIIGAGVLFGDAGDDDIRAIGAATINGGVGNDSLDSGVGSNILLGGSGDDTLVAGATGFDVLIGGPGQDKFIWDQVGALNTVAIGPSGSVVVGADSVQDFQNGSDQLYFDVGAILKGVQEAASNIYRLISGLPGNTVNTQNFFQTANGGQFTHLNGIFGSYANVTSLQADIAAQNYSGKTVNATTPLYGFARNTASTVLWLVSVYSNPTRNTYYANVETLKIGGVFATSIILI